MTRTKKKNQLYFWTLTTITLLFLRQTQQAYSVSEDKYKARKYIRPSQKMKFDLSRRLDFYAMSSNFSSNNDDILLPGVAGRQEEAASYFPDTAFSPKNLNSAYGHLFFLEKDGRTFRDFSIESNSEYSPISSAFGDWAKENAEAFCSDLVTIGKFVFFVCFEEPQDQQAECRYSLVVLDLLLNKIVLDSSFEDSCYSNPHINGFEQNETAGKFNLVMFNKLPLLDNPKLFEKNTGISIISVYLDPEGEEFKVLGIVSRSVASEVYADNFDSFRLINFSFIGVDSIFVYVNELRSGSLQKFLFSCQAKLDPGQEILQFQGCSQLIESSIKQFHSNKNNLVYFDHEDRLFFCKLSRKQVDIKCKSGVFKKDWGLKLFKIVNDVALVVAESDGVDIIFLNYFSQDIFTWYYTRELQNHPTFIVETTNNHDYKMLSFPARGFQVTDLSFSTHLVVYGHELNQLNSSLIYLEGVPILEYHFTVWDGSAILNLFQGISLNVVYTRADRVFFQQLGFAGNNLDFKDNSMQKIYYFSPSSTFLQNLPTITEGEAENMDDFPVVRQVHFYSTLTGDLIYLFYNKVVISEYEIDPKLLEISEANIREITFPPEFELAVENIVQTKSRANEIFILLRAPFQVVSVNRRSLGLIYYEMHADFKNKEVASCMLHDGYLTCVHSMRNFETISFYIFKERRLESLKELNIQVVKKIFTFFKNTADGRKVSNISILSAENESTRPNYFSIILKLEFGGIFELHGFSFRIRAQARSEFSEEIVWKLEKFRTIEQLSKPGMLLNNPQISLVGRNYLVLETEPKFQLFWFDELNRTDFEYLDTNEVLRKFVSREYQLVVVVYRSLSDQLLYFAVFRLTDNCLRQFVRNQRLGLETPHLHVDFIRFSPTIISIVFVDLAFQRVLFSYVYFLSGPFLLGKTHSDVVINDMRYVMDITEDKSMHYNRFVNKEPPTLVVDEFDLLAEIPIKKYFEIEGNIDYLSLEKFADPALNDQVEIVEGINYKDTVDLISSVPEKEDASELKYIENPKWFAVNIKDTLTFSVFEKKTGRLKVDISFDLEEESSCVHLSITNSSLYCMYFLGSEHLVQTRSIKYSDQAPTNLRTADFGRDYQVLVDNAIYLVFLNKNLSATGFEIVKVHKGANFYERVYVQSEDLGEVSLFIHEFAAYYNSDNNILSLLLVNSMSQTLHIFTAFFIPNDMNLQKIKTINDAFDLSPLDPTIFGISCDPLVEQYQFSCILSSNNQFYDVTVVKHIKAEISPFKWEFKVNYTYKNLFFEEFWLRDPRFITIVSEQYFLLIFPSSERSGIALYERFASPYVKDFQTLDPADDSVSLQRVFGAFLCENNDSLKLVGLSQEKNGALAVSTYTFEEQKIIVHHPHQFVGNKLQFKLDFFNGKSIKFVFNLKASKKMDPKETQKRSGLVIFLFSLMILLVMLILGNLLVLVLMLKKDRDEEMESVLMSDRSSMMEESFRATNLRNTRL